MRVVFRNPGPPDKDWSEYVGWPRQARIPVAGELVTLPVHGQVRVESVQWFLDDETVQHHGPDVQLIVRVS